MNEEKKLINLQNKIKEIMWEKTGIIRTKKGLKKALMEIKKLERKLNEGYTDRVIHKTIIETRNMITVAELIIQASLKRNKSMGCFYLSQ